MKISATVLLSDLTISHLHREFSTFVPPLVAKSSGARHKPFKLSCSNVTQSKAWCCSERSSKIFFFCFRTALLGGIGSMRHLPLGINIMKDKFLILKSSCRKGISTHTGCLPFLDFKGRKEMTRLVNRSRRVKRVSPFRGWMAKQGRDPPQRAGPGRTRPGWDKPRIQALYDPNKLWIAPADNWIWCTLPVGGREEPTCVIIVIPRPLRLRSPAVACGPIPCAISRLSSRLLPRGLMRSPKPQHDLSRPLCHLSSLIGTHTE